MLKPLIVQISIPFCFKRCSYCGYPFCTYDASVIRAYINALLGEMEAVSADMSEYVVTAVSIEGGSPALATPEGLCELLQGLSANYNLAEDVQISLQTMPGDYSRALMEKMRDHGVNFWVVGLQTAQREEHHLLDRSYKYDAITMVDMALHTFHPRLLSFDLLCGIPGQTLRSFAQTLQRVLVYQPDHLTIYPLRLEKNTLLYQRVNNRELVMPDPSFLAECSALAREKLENQGLLPYTIYDYALPNARNRFKTGQLSGLPQLGLGYHSRTLIDGITYTSGHSLQEYIDHSRDFEIIAAGLTKLDDNTLQALEKQRRAMLPDAAE